jgi:hypothetical protein
VRDFCHAVLDVDYAAETRAISSTHSQGRRSMKPRAATCIPDWWTRQSASTWC